VLNQGLVTNRLQCPSKVPSIASLVATLCVPPALVSHPALYIGEYGPAGEQARQIDALAPPRKGFRPRHRPVTLPRGPATRPWVRLGAASNEALSMSAPSGVARPQVLEGIVGPWEQLRA